MVIRAMVGVALLIVFVAVTLNAKRTLRSRSVKTISVLVVVPAIVSVVESIGAAVTVKETAPWAGGSHAANSVAIGLGFRW